LELGLIPGWIGSQQAAGQVGPEAQSQQEDMGNSHDFLSLLNQFDPSEQELLNPKDGYVGKSSDEVAAHIMDSEESDTVAVTPALAVNSPLLSEIQKSVYQKPDLDLEQNDRISENRLDDLDRLRLKFFMQEDAIFRGAPDRKIADYRAFMNDPVTTVVDDTQRRLHEGAESNRAINEPQVQKIALPKEFNLEPSSREFDSSKLRLFENSYQHSNVNEFTENDTAQFFRESTENHEIEKNQMGRTSEISDSSKIMDDSSVFSNSSHPIFDDSNHENAPDNPNSSLEQRVDTKESFHQSFDPQLVGVSASIKSAVASELPQSAKIPDVNQERIYQAAQLLVEKGGGSAKIKLSPEGMGEIELRIRVLGDNVNVQFVAENSETKEIFEKSIQKLKSQLEAQNLKVDSLSVQVAEAKSSSFSDFARDHSQSNPNLGLLRDMLNQSRQESFARQSNTFMEWDGIRSYGRKSQASPEPISSALETNAKVKRYQGIGRGQRLSLVG